MIITGKKILSYVEDKYITIDPFQEQNISTNSYDISLGRKYIRYLDKILDPFKENKFEEKEIPEKGLLLNKGDFILAESAEVIGSNRFVPLVHGKSGVARKGLFVHITANLVDIGYLGRITFQLYATQTIVIHRNMRIAQLSFWVPKGEIRLYEGKYQGGKGPQASKIYLDQNKNIHDNI